MAVTVRQTTVNVTVGGSSIDYIMSVRWSTGFDLQVGEASIVCAQNPAGGYYDDVVITVNGIERWRGVLVQRDFTLYPVQVTLVCRDPLYAAQAYIPPEELEDGLYLEDFLGASSGTDQDIVAAVLSTAGVSNVGGIGGTSYILGTVAPEEFLWRRNETALSYISRIDAISLGYRTYFNGAFVVRTPISITSGSSSKTFTEGVDISRGSATRTILERYTAVRVGGYDVGDFEDPRVWFEPGSGDDRVFNFESKMIERKSEAHEGEGMTCEAVAGYWIGELDHELVRVQMTTPRDDLLLPGQFHTIEASNRLGTGQALWVQRVDGEVTQSGAVSQSLQYIGG